MKKNKRSDPCSKRINAIMSAGNVKREFLETVRGSIESVPMDRFRFANPDWSNSLPHICRCYGKNGCRAAFFNHLNDRLFRMRKDRDEKNR